MLMRLTYHQPTSPVFRGYVINWLFWLLIKDIDIFLQNNILLLRVVVRFFSDFKIYQLLANIKNLIGNLTKLIKINLFGKSLNIIIWL